MPTRKLDLSNCQTIPRDNPYFTIKVDYHQIELDLLVRIANHKTEDSNRVQTLKWLRTLIGLDPKNFEN